MPKRMPRIALPSAPPSRVSPIVERCPSTCRASKRSSNRTAAHPVAAVALVSFGGPAAYAFALLHGAGNGIVTIAKGTLPLALFGAAGYGRRIGWLNAPARVLQAAAPLIFGAALTAWGLSAIWLTAGIGVASFVALLALRRT